MSPFATIDLLILCALGPRVYAIANITVLWNDARLVYDGLDEGVRLFGDPNNAGKGCVSGFQATSTAGSSVSLNFTGTALQYSFLADNSGADAAILLNGTQVDLVPTFQTDAVAYSTCSVITKSIAVDSGTHQVTIVNSPLNTNLTAMYFQSVAYTPPDDSVTSAQAPAPAASTGHSAAIGGAIAGVAGVSLILAATFYTRRRKNQNRIIDLIGVESEEAADHELKDGPSGQDQNWASTPFILGADSAYLPTTLPVAGPSHIKSSSPATHVNPPPLVASSSPFLPSTDRYRRNEEAQRQPIEMQPIPAGGVGSNGISRAATAPPSSLTPALILNMMEHNIPGPEIAALIRSVTARQERDTAQASSSHAGMAQVVMLSPSGATAPPAYDYTTKASPERDQWPHAAMPRDYVDRVNHDK